MLKAVSSTVLVQLEYVQLLVDLSVNVFGRITEHLAALQVQFSAFSVNYHDDFCVKIVRNLIP